MTLFRTLLALRGHEVTGLPGGDGLLETIERTSPEPYITKPIDIRRFLELVHQALAGEMPSP